MVSNNTDLSADSDTNALQYSDCSVCLDNIMDNLTLTKCNHVFHSTCIGQWIEQEKDTCPVCRGSDIGKNIVVIPSSLSPYVSIALQKLSLNQVKEIISDSIQQPSEGTIQTAIASLCKTIKMEISELHKASRDGDLDKVKKLLSEGANINQIGWEVNPTTIIEGVTPLMLAVKAGKLSIVTALLASNANVFLLDANDQSCFEYAFKTEQFDCLKTLVGSSLNPPTVDSFSKLVKFLKEDTLDYLIRQEIIRISGDNKLRWILAGKYSERYCDLLGLSSQDLLQIEDLIQGYRGLQPSLMDRAKKGFCKVQVEDKIFSFFVDTTCATDYETEAGWMKRVQVACINDLSLNDSMGAGYSLINVIREEWHRKLCTGLSSNIKDLVRDKINFSSSANSGLWNRTCRHHAGYQEKLGLSDADLEKILRHLQSNAGMLSSLMDHASSGFHKLEVEGMKFTLFVHHTAGNRFGVDNPMLIKAVCENNPSLNNCSVRATGLINAVPEEWHAKICDKLDETIKTQLREKITFNIDRNRRIWSQVKSRTTEYRQAIDLTESNMKRICDSTPGYRYPSWIPNSDTSSFVIDVEGKKFRLTANSTYAGNYGSSWENTLKAYCLDDSELNENTGRGTSFINIVPEEWHQKILDTLRVMRQEYEARQNEAR